MLKITLSVLNNAKRLRSKINRKSLPLIIFIAVLLISIPFLTLQQLNEPFEKIVFKFNKPPNIESVKKENNSAVLSTQTGKYKYPDDYTIILLGDSMTERLGNSDEIRGYLSEYYPQKTIEVLNYGYGATNILSVMERLISRTEHFRDFRPITEIDFDLILIESFGNNPLSEYPLAEGLQKQNQALDEITAVIRERNPRAKIAFLTTIAPNKENYAKSSIDLSDEIRDKWVEERKSYIENHIKYAEDHNIPLINVYKDSQDLFGDGKMIYIDDKDFIHPSPLGVIFISRKIAEQITKQKLLP